MSMDEFDWLKVVQALLDGLLKSRMLHASWG